MIRQTLAAAAFSALVAAPAISQDSVFKSAVHDYRLVTVAAGLVNPWSMAFLPNGDMLVTERPGRLRIVRKGKLLDAAVEGVPVVAARGQGGLLDIALHPNFATNHLLYFSYSKAMGDSGLTTTAVARGSFENDRVSGLQDIFVAQTKGTVGHFGSRLAFDRDGYLFVTVGDRMVPPAGNLEAHPAQDLSNHHGKIVRLRDDGTAPTDNPFVGREGARPEIWSYGHRNPQALAINPANGDVWETEHGPQGGDELNLIKKGANYGWPVIGYGVNYRTGAAIHSATMKAGMEQPANVWVPSIAVSGMLFYTGSKFPGWKRSLFVGGMAGQQVGRLTIDGEKAELVETIVRHQGRIRDIRQSPEGFIYLAIDDEKGEPTRLLRMEPVARR